MRMPRSSDDHRGIQYHSDREGRERRRTCRAGRGQRGPQRSPVPRESDGDRHRGIVRRGSRPHRALPQGRDEKLPTGLDDHQDRRPQGCDRPARRESRGRRATPGPEAQVLAVGLHMESATAAKVAVTAPNAKVADGATATQRKPATKPEASFTTPTLVWYAPRTVALMSGGAKSATRARCVPSAMPYSRPERLKAITRTKRAFEETRSGGIPRHAGC